MGSRRQSVLGPCRGPPGAPAGRGRPRRRRGGRRRPAAGRGVYLRRHGGERAGADAGAAPGRRANRSGGCWSRPSSTPRCCRAGGFRRRRSGPSRSPDPAWSTSTICGGLLADGPPALVSVMLANNETGAIQPVGEVADIVHEAGGLLHVDAIQALGKIPFDIKAMKADLVTLSAHKIGGPKGVGALVLAEERAGAGAAAAGRRSGAGPPGRNRECRGDRGLWRGRAGRHGRPGRRCSPAAGPAGPP